MFFSFWTINHLRVSGGFRVGLFAAEPDIVKPIAWDQGGPGLLRRRFLVFPGRTFLIRFSFDKGRPLVKVTFDFAMYT